MTDSLRNATEEGAEGTGPRRSRPRTSSRPDPRLRRHPRRGAALLDRSTSSPAAKRHRRHRLRRRLGARRRRRRRSANKRRTQPPERSPRLQPRPAPRLRSPSSASGRPVPVTIEVGRQRTPPLQGRRPRRRTSPRSLEFFGSDADPLGQPRRPRPRRPTRQLPGQSARSGHRPEPRRMRRAGCPKALHHPAARLRAARWRPTGKPTPGSTPAPGSSGSALTHDDAGNPQGMSGCGSSASAPRSPPGRPPAPPRARLGPGLRPRRRRRRHRQPRGRAALRHPQDRSRPCRAGMTINPSQAEGLEVCTEADLARETPSRPPARAARKPPRSARSKSRPRSCPKRPLQGRAVSSPTPYANPAGSLIALYMVIKDPGLGVLVTQAARGRARPGHRPAASRPPKTCPSCPSRHFRLHFREGGRAPLITPARLRHLRHRAGQALPLVGRRRRRRQPRPSRSSSGPRRPLPLRRRPLPPRLRGGLRRTTPPAATPPSTCASPAATANRT